LGELWRIRDAATFAALGRTSRRARRGPVWVRWVPDTPPAAAAPRVAFAVGRRVGSAVSRNLLRRRLRAVLREMDLPAGGYLVGVTGPEALALSYADLNALVHDIVGDLR
jgi:ribonuclease P protein component